MVNIIDALRPFIPLIYKDKEWGGYVNPLTGEVEGLREGEEDSVYFDLPEEVVAKRDQGWRVFHTHPIDDDDPSPGPSGNDCIFTCFYGIPQYVVTARGIFEVSPSNEVLPPKERRRLANEARAKTPQRFLRDTLLQLALPVKVTLLFEIGQENGRGK